MAFPFTELFIGASSLFQAKAARDAGKAQEADYEFNAMVEEREAAIEAVEVRERIKRERLETKRLIATQRAVRAASGVSVDTGSALAAQAQEAAMGRLRELELLRESQSIQDARFNRAIDFRRRGKSARKSGEMQAGVSLLEGAARILSL